jgi:pimeloyl-ACP methyl ester carboxylesterase
MAALAAMILACACQTPSQPSPDRGAGSTGSTRADPASRQVQVNGATLHYIEVGQGVPVVFVHGSISDARAWDAQRLAISQRYRFVALTQRYFGPGAATGSGKDFSQTTHAADLTAFIQSLGAGPVHLVGWSYGGLTALLVTRQHPELVRSLTMHEPGVRSLIADTPEGRQALAEFSHAALPAAEAAKKGDADLAAQLFHEAMYSLARGGFASEPQAVQRMVLENAGTMVLARSAPPPPAIACDSLRTVRTPALVTRGENAQAHYRLISDRLASCLGNAALAVIPGANHDAPMRNPQVFNATLLNFLAAH